MYKNRKVRNRVIAAAEAKSPPLLNPYESSLSPTTKKAGIVNELETFTEGNSALIHDEKKMIDGLSIGILPLNIHSARVALLSKRITEFGGTFLPHKKSSLSSFKKATHVIVEDATPISAIVAFCQSEIEKELLQKSLETTKYVRCKWLSESFTKRTRLSEEDYTINMLLQEEITRADVLHHLNKYRQNVSPTKPASAASGPDSTCEGNSTKSINGEKDDTVEVISGVPATPTGAMLPVTVSPSRKRLLVDGDVSDYQDSCEEHSDDDDLDDSGRKDISMPSTSFTIESSVTEKYVCSQASSSSSKNLNEHLTIPLEKLMNTHKSQGQDFRSMAYGKAISALRNFPRKIECTEDVSSLRNIGASILSKIAEILENGTCEKVENLCVDDEVNKCIALFCNIHGVSSKTAIKWASAKLRTLEDIATKVTLNRVQQIGLKHYHDFLDRIPRSEVQEIERVVAEQSLLLQEGLEVITCGSYRRGKSTCGDVDILISHPDGKSHRNIFGPLLEKLHTSGFLTDDLLISEESSQKKYLGVCRLSTDNSKFRRLDIIVVPYNEFGCALLYFTGSAHFNRSMRAYAHKLNMTLSHHSLNRNVVRMKKVKISEGDVCPNLTTEKAIFQCMGLPYLEPKDRDH